MEAEARAKYLPCRVGHVEYFILMIFRKVLLNSSQLAVQAAFRCVHLLIAGFIKALALVDCL